MIVNQAPWMTAMEMHLQAIDVTQFLLKHDTTSEHRSGWNIDYHLLRASSPFAWSSEVIDAVLEASKSIPLDTPLSRWNLDSPAAWWYFEKPLPFQTVTRPCGVDALNFGWLPTNTDDLGMPVICWVRPTEQDELEERGVVKACLIAPTQTWEWEPHLTLGEMLDISREHHRELYGPTGKWRHKPIIGEDKFMEAAEGLSRFILAGLAWLGQKVLRTDDGHIERHRRKAFAKALGHDRVRAVSVVQLRRYESGPKEPTEATGEHRDFSCRWVVGGHWRNQVCGPKRGDRKLTYIHPYLKGPDDKPLRVPTKKIYEVSR